MFIPIYECMWARKSMGVCMVKCVCMYVWICASMCTCMYMYMCGRRRRDSGWGCGCGWVLGPEVRSCCVGVSFGSSGSGVVDRDGVGEVGSEGVVGGGCREPAG